MSHVKEYRCLKKVIHQIDRKCTVTPFSKFYGEIWVAFCLNTTKCFFLEVFFKVLSCTRDFQNKPPFERSACFYVTITGNFACFWYFNFESNFLNKRKLYFKKLEYRFLVESTKIENATFQFKTTLSEGNGPITMNEVLLYFFENFVST